MSYFVNLNFWFNSRPAPFTYGSKIAIGLFIITMAALFIFLRVGKKKKGYNSKTWLSLADFALTNIIIALAILFFSLELVPFLSAKFWVLLWLVEMISWLSIVFQRLKKSQLKKEAAEKEKNFKKYLPKKQ